MNPKFKNPSKEVSERMKKVKSKDTSIEREMERTLKELGVEYEKQPGLVGSPDFRIKNTKILVYCDSSFWHGRREKEVSGKAFRKNKELWVKKITENRRRDQRTNKTLRRNGWSVQRFWDTDITKKPEKVKRRLRRLVEGSEVTRLTAIDLCCGAGGLTLGLKRAGFNVVAGIEVNEEIAKTYEANHPDARTIVEDLRNTTGKRILEVVGLQKIDLVAGCPPCQGFSSLTSKYKRDDPRNDLVIEMARVIEELRPEMVMMENVSGITSRGEKVLDEFVLKLESLGYAVNMGILQMADYGVPQHRRRFVLFAGKGFRIEFPRKTHSQMKGDESRLETWKTLGGVIGKMRKPVTLSQAKKKGSPQDYNWHVVRDLKEVSISRIKVSKAGSDRASLPKALRPKCHKDTDKGFINVYGRLSWHQLPPTITTGFTKLSTGRFGHPEELRTISVREAAMIQTFPNNYKFKTDSIETVCNLIGNALPPRFAEIAAKACKNAFYNREAKSKAIK